MSGGFQDDAGRGPRSPWRPLLLAGVLVVTSAAAVVYARTDSAGESIIGGAQQTQRRDDRQGTVELLDAGEAPTLAIGEGWLGGAAPRLDGKVVIYQFWTFGCVSCRHTLPYLRALYDRYQPEGMEIVGIHYPEFAYERDRAAIADAAEEHGVTWPVLFDGDGHNWRNFENRFWPRWYVLDAFRHIRFDHIGEGAYLETEDAVRQLLGIVPDAPRAVFPDGP